VPDVPNRNQWKRAVCGLARYFDWEGTEIGSWPPRIRNRARVYSLGASVANEFG